MSNERQGTREQRLLRGIHKAIGPTPKPKPLLSRAQSLPMMIQRHGPAQTLLFLESKTNDEDKKLAEIFRAALKVAEPSLAERLPAKDPRELKAYLEPDLTQRLHLTLCCVELANLLMRTLKVIDAAEGDV